MMLIAGNCESGKTAGIDKLGLDMARKSILGAIADILIANQVTRITVMLVLQCKTEVHQECELRFQSRCLKALWHSFHRGQ